MLLGGVIGVMELQIGPAMGIEALKYISYPAQVLEKSSKQLSVPVCTRLSIEGVSNNLKAFKSNERASCIKQIRTGGFYGITYDHFKELGSFLLRSDNNTHQKNFSPHNYWMMAGTLLSSKQFQSTYSSITMLVEAKRYTWTWILTRFEKNGRAMRSSLFFKIDFLY